MPPFGFRQITIDEFTYMKLHELAGAEYRPMAEIVRQMILDRARESEHVEDTATAGFAILAQSVGATPVIMIQYSGAMVVLDIDEAKNLSDAIDNAARRSAQFFTDVRRSKKLLRVFARDRNVVVSVNGVEGTIPKNTAHHMAASIRRAMASSSDLSDSAS